MILLDTHAWIWLLADPEKLSKTALDAIQKQIDDHQILISAMSVWEFFLLVKKSRLNLKAPPTAFLTATHGDSRMGIIPIDDTVVRLSVELPYIHTDPADRMILATAAELGCPIVSRDARFTEYNVAPVIW